MKSITLFLMILFLGFISNACTFYPIWDTTDLKLYDKDFSDIYSEREEVVGMKTAGFYYRLDSVLVYKYGDGYRHKAFFESINPSFAKEKYQPLKMYYLDYLWIMNDGTFYFPNWEYSTDTPEKHNHLIDGAPLGNSFVMKQAPYIEMLTDSILKSVENHYRLWFLEKGLNSYYGKGVLQSYSEVQLKFYRLYHHFDLPPGLELIHGRKLTDSTFIINKEYPVSPVFAYEYYKDFYERINQIIEPWLYKFHASEVIPSEDFMPFER